MTAFYVEHPDGSGRRLPVYTTADPREDPKTTLHAVRENAKRLYARWNDIPKLKPPERYMYAIQVSEGPGSVTLEAHYCTVRMKRSAAEIEADFARPSW